MYLKCTCTALVAVLACLQPAPATADGNMLLQRCQTVLRTEERGGGPASNADAMASTFCFGYINGVLDFQSSARKDVAYFCLPEGASRMQALRVVVKFLTDHPERLHEHEVNLVIFALREAFPC